MSTGTQKITCFNDYLQNIVAQTYDDLTACINSEISWDNGYAAINPAMFEIFNTHQHLGRVREAIFNTSGTDLYTEPDNFDALAACVAEIWKSHLPELFPGHNFIICKDPLNKQLSFCRQRMGITDDPEQIIVHLTHHHQNIRWNALLSATLFPHPRLVPHLLPRLEDEHMANVLQAINALGECGNEEILEVLLSKFLSFDKGTDGKLCMTDIWSYDLFRAILTCGEKGCRKLLQITGHYQSLDSETLEDLCEILGKTNRSDVLELLLQIHFDPSIGNQPALTGLLHMEKSAIPRVIPFLKDSNPLIRQKAMWFMSSCYHNIAYPYILQGLKDKNRYIREAAVQGISRFCHPDRHGLLLKATQDKAGLVRARAVKALNERAVPGLLSYFAKLCLDKNSTVRSEAMRALAALGTKQALGFLSSLLDHSTKSEKIRLIEALYAYTGNTADLHQIIKQIRELKDKRLTREIEELLSIIEK